MPPDHSPSAPSPPIAPSARSGGPRFHFSLRWLMIAVTAVALLLGLAATVGNVVQWVVWCAIIWVLPVPLVIGAVFGRGDPRVFSTGALVPWIGTWINGAAPYAVLQSSSIRFSQFLMIAVIVVSSGLCGWVALLSRQWLERRGMTREQ